MAHNYTIHRFTCVIFSFYFSSSKKVGNQSRSAVLCAWLVGTAACFLSPSDWYLPKSWTFDWNINSFSKEGLLYAWKYCCCLTGALSFTVLGVWVHFFWVLIWFLLFYYVINYLVVYAFVGFLCRFSCLRTRVFLALEQMLVNQIHMQ